MTKYLHIGCGKNILPRPFYNLDFRKGKNVDHVSPAYPLKFKSNSFDLVYASHILEHFHKFDTQKVLNEWVRVLKPGGIIRLSVPSIDSLIDIYNHRKDLTDIVGPLFGGQNYKGNFHYNIFNKKTLTTMLKISGCEAIHPWNYKRTIHSEYWDFSQAQTLDKDISLNIEGRKKIKNSKNIQNQIINDFKYKIKFLKKKLNRKDFNKLIEKIINE